MQDEEEKEETAIGVEITKDGRRLIRKKGKGKRENENEQTHFHIDLTPHLSVGVSA